MLLRAAALRTAANDWRGALDGLRTIAERFPDRRPAVQRQESEAVRAMLDANGGTLSALDIVLLASEHAAAVSSGPGSAAMARLLSDKLLALDLPNRAVPLLQGLIRGAPTGPARAEFGSRLSQLLIEAGSPADALTALDASRAPDLPGPLAMSRKLLRARALAATHDMPGAVTLLQSLGGDEADALRADLLEQAGDLRGSLDALATLSARLLPASGPIPDALQDKLLHQASIAARLHDTAALQSLSQHAPRLTGPRADLLRTLTAAPIAAPRDLPRSRSELALAREVPGRLQSWPAR